LNSDWTEFNDVDPDTYTQATGLVPPDCEHWDWQWTPSATDEHTNPGNYAACNEMITAWGPGSTVHGPIFSDDSIYIMGKPSFLGPVKTADPWCQFVNPDSQSGSSKATCAGVNGVVGPGGSEFNAGTEVLPATNDTLQSIAAADGCVYLGPTFITLNGPGANQPASMTVTGPDGALPTVGTLSASNTNQCQPSGLGASVALPKNGTVYLADAPVSPSCAAQQSLTNEIEASGASADPPGCRGDAIVNGSLYGDLTIAASNNIVIDGNLTYCQDPATVGATPKCPSTLSITDPVPTIPGTGSSAATSSVLGLMANQYVELNNPYTAPTPPNANQVCGNAGAPAPPNCVLGNVFIEAAILALNHSFIAPGLPARGSTSSITVIGSVVEKYAPSVQLEFNAGFIEFETGYQTDFYWDPRLSVLSPPFFFEAGQDGSAPNWSLTSSTVSLATPCSGLSLPAPQGGPAQQGPVGCADVPPPS
jgi:hypothetical protein